MTNKDLGLFDDEFDNPFDNDHSEEKISEQVSEYIPPDIEQYSDNNKKKAYQKLALIKWLEKRIAGGWTKNNLSPLLIEAQSHFKFELPNWRTVARWHSEYCQSGKAIEALVPKHHRKGTSGHQKRDDGIFFEKILKEHYLTTRRPSIASSYILYKSYITTENSKLDGIKLVPLSRRAFFYRIKKLPPYETMLMRYGRDYADRFFRTIRQLPKVSRVLERVEIDHTPLDLILVDDNLLLALGRPYITALIDCYSKCIIGFYIGYKEPSYDSVRRALANACLSKEWINKQYPCIKKTWPCEGKIGVLVPDNASEFWSSSLDDACLSQVGDIDFNQVGKPWLKPLIEKFFGTLNEKLLVSIPGKTFSNATELKGYKPEKDAVMRFSTFLELLHKWIIDIYHYQPNSKGTEIPIIKWNESIERISVPIYRGYSAEKLLIDLAKVDICALENDGIHINNLRYSSEELTAYRKIAPLTQDSGKPTRRGIKNPKVKVKTIHTSVAAIYVYLDLEKRYIKVPCVDQEYSNDLTLLQHQTNVQFVKRYIKSKTEIEHLAEANVYLHERIMQEITDVTKLLNKRKNNIGSTKKLAKYNDIGSDNINSLSSGFGKINSTKENNEDNSWDDYKPTEDSYE